MYRFIEEDLKQWRRDKKPQPLILRGARQVGKTFTVEKFVRENFQNFIKINFELESKYKKFFEDLDPHKLLETIAIQKDTKIERGKTLLFFDEIQECPRAIQALRYLYENVPGLHVIAAGSLLEFALRSEKFKVPVGRISYLFLQPLSFYEFLIACEKRNLFEYIKNLDLKKGGNSVIHETLLDELRKYLILGGMPKVIEKYIVNKNQADKGFGEALKIHHQIIQTYKEDFGKYAKASRHTDLEAVFEYVPQSICQKFKYSKVYPGADSKDMKTAFDLLVKAGVVHKIRRTTGNLPLGAGISEQHFKSIFLDVGLMQSVYGMDLDAVLSNNFFAQTAGGLAEQFVGQELLTIDEFYKERKLYYWERESSQSSAEIDYLINIRGKVIPIEVKAGVTGRLKSMHLFMNQYQVPYGIRISQKDLELQDSILSVPLYATAEIKRILVHTC